MSERIIYNLKIDESFKRLIPPLSSEELEQLELNIIRDGCREPLSVWNNTILDGHNRYEICTRLQIPFTIQRTYVKNNEEAIAWICANQLGRRNITDETRKYLIGKRYEMEKILGVRNTVGANQHTKKEVWCKILTKPPYDETACRTRERIGEEYHISDGTVNRYGIYAHALDALSKVVPELVPKVLSGQVKIPHDNIVEMSRLSHQDVLRLSKDLTDNAINFVGYSDTRKLLPKRQNTQKHLLPILAGSVKDMPAYDPDAEISSLALTIPSWVSTIDRTHCLAKLNKVSRNARSNLEKELLALRETINTMLTALKEEI